MRGKGFVLLAVGLLSLCGCLSTDNQIRPPEQAEQFNAPPVADARYSGPPSYPRNLLNKGGLRRADTADSMGGPTFGGAQRPMRGGSPANLTNGNAGGF